MLVRCIRIVHIVVVGSFSLQCSIPLYKYTKMYLSFLLFMGICVVCLEPIMRMLKRFSYLSFVNTFMYFYDLLEWGVFNFTRY